MLYSSPQVDRIYQTSVLQSSLLMFCSIPGSKWPGCSPYANPTILQSSLHILYSATSCRQSSCACDHLHAPVSPFCLPNRQAAEYWRPITAVDHRSHRWYGWPALGMTRRSAWHYLGTWQTHVALPVFTFQETCLMIAEDSWKGDFIRNLYKEPLARAVCKTSPSSLRSC